MLVAVGASLAPRPPRFAFPPARAFGAIADDPANVRPEVRVIAARADRPYCAGVPWTVPIHAGVP